MARKAKAVVVCDETNNTPADVAAGCLRVDVSVPLGVDSIPLGVHIIKPKVEVVLVDKPTRLVTVEVPGPTPSKAELKDAIVRIVAAPGQTMEACEDVAKELAKHANRVVVVPFAVQTVVPNASHRETQAESFREVLTALVEASGYPDKAELGRAVEAIASEVGL